MTISGAVPGSSWNSWVPDALTKIHTSLDLTAQQMATGKVGQTYSSLGSNVAQSIDLNAKLTAIDASAVGIASAKTSLSTVDNTITSFLNSASSISNGPFSSVKGTDSASRRSMQSGLRDSFSSTLDYLNTQDDKGYLFGGKVQDVSPALPAATILDGDPTTGKTGLSDYITERQTADMGANGLGRLTLNLPTGGTTLTLFEEAAGLPFGMTLNSVSSTLDNATATLSTTSPKSLGVTFSGVPTSGKVFTVTFNLPDGTTTNVSLTAGATNSSSQFAIGADAASTAVNFQTALTSSLKTTASTALAGSSAIKASKDFFAGSLTLPPQRVAIPSGGTAATATAFVTDPTTNAANTVIWYRGTDAKTSGDPRLDRVIQISRGVNVGFGVRGNEPGFADMLASIGAAVVTKFSTTDETLAQEQFSDLVDRSKTTLSKGKTETQSVVTSLAASQAQVRDVTDRYTASKSLYASLISTLEDASPEKTAAQLTQLQTQLQIAYQVTSKVMKMTLADYL
jgi:flagellin-like hook-associated protein FlgL